MAKSGKASWEVALDKASATIAENSALLAEMRASAAEAEAKNAAKSAKEMADLRRIVRENGKLIGTYIGDEGEMLEQQVAAAIIKKMALGGVCFDEVITNAHVHGKHGDGEFDWIGINGKITMVGETRRTLERGDVRRFFADRMELFKRSRYNHHAKGKEVRGVMIYQTAKAGAVEEALKLGMMVFRAEGKKTLRPVQTPADIPPKRTQTKTRKTI
ncbi:MAG: hypothetical protein ACR2P4_07300 [Gammaproteobacteria bacterium]